MKTGRWTARVSAIGLLVSASNGATDEGDDPAARGLDAFVHMPEGAPSGAAHRAVN